ITNAHAHLLINANVISTKKLATRFREAGFKENIWQVNFNDMLSTSLYFNADNGEFITVRSNIWRVFDVFWMLHIMDYD
ncbi:hypothetical protein SB749_20825, partial [Brevibacterium sp. SIMBA_078]